jgi:tetratricopeptide (TPR) repeat protein
LRNRARPQSLLVAGLLSSLVFCDFYGAGLLKSSAQALSSTDPLALARSYLDQSHYGDAEKELRSYLSSHPVDSDARYLLGYTLFRENKPADSLKEYTEAARLRTPRADNLKIVSLDYVLLNDYSDAERWSKYAISLDAKDSESWYELGRIEYTLNHFQEAVNCFETSLKLDPASVKAQNNLGLAMEGLNRTDDAVASYRKALALQATSEHPSEQPMLNLATLLIDRNQLSEARPLLEEASHIAPHDWKILAQLGRLNSETGDLIAAENALEQAVAIEPKRASLHFQLGQLYRKTGAAEKAAHELSLAQQLLGTSSSPIR